MEKIFKNKQEKNKVKDIVTWIDATYDDLNFEKYSNRLEEVYSKLLNDNDKILLDAFIMCRLDDDDNKCEPEEIFNVMIPQLMERSFSLADSDLAKLQQRTSKSFKDVVNNVLKDIPENVEKIIKEEINEEKVEDKKSSKKVEPKNTKTKDEEEDDDPDIIDADIVSELNKIDSRATGVIIEDKKNNPSEDANEEKVEELEGYQDYVNFINTDFRKRLVTDLV